MEVEGITFTLQTLLSIIFGAVGAVGVWYKSKGKTDLLQVETETLKEELKGNKADHKEDKLILNNRIDKLEKEVKYNRERSDNSTVNLEAAMNKMELRIIKAIHEIK